jgi:hypothetical protein
VVCAAEPCKLLTVEEIGRALGATVSNTTPLGTTGCIWATDSSKVTLTLKDAKDPSRWERVTTPVPGVTKSSVNGLGEAAQIAVAVESGNAKDAYATLSVKQGANIITLGVYGPKDPNQQSALEQSLARIVLGRL